MVLRVKQEQQDHKEPQAHRVIPDRKETKAQQVTQEHKVL